MSRARGFTLLELLVTVAILGLLLGIGTPIVASIGDGMRLAAITSTFLSQLHLARSEAIKRNAPVSLCKSRDGARCAPGGGWEQGWIVFHDADNDSLRAPQEIVLQRHEALPAGFRLAGNVPVNRYVSFAPTGGTRTPSGAFQAGTLTVCKASAQATAGRQIVINAVGRPRWQKVELERCG